MGLAAFGFEVGPFECRPFGGFGVVLKLSQGFSNFGCFVSCVCVCVFFFL